MRWVGRLHRATKLFVTLVIVGAVMSSAQPGGAPAFATGGLPIVTKVHGILSAQELLTADREVQTAYIAGVLDAFLAVVGEGEAFAEVGLDPRNAYGLVYEAITNLPNLTLEDLRKVVIEATTTGAEDKAAVLVVWRNLALYHCC